MFKRLLHIFLMLLAVTGWSQNQSSSIQIRSADELTYDRERGDARVLRGNVVCEHEGALLYCDSALIYEKENRMVARGHILITKGDSIRITGDRLVYEGKTRLATLENNVRCIDKEMVLTTNLLTFDVKRSIANYYNGGTIVNKENTLTSKNGHYYSATREASFHYDVVLTNPDYKMNSDTLKYRLSNKTSYFLGPSIITSKSDYIYCENGWYDTEKEKSQFSRNALLVTAQQKLKGDSMTYDRIAKVGRAFRNVSLVDTSQKSIIYGHYIEYKQEKSEALVTDKALYARILDQDTLFIAADTLYHRDIDSVNNFLNAYHHVKIFKKDLQGISDSASMNTKDSLLQLFNTPVLWTQGSQATSRIIKIDIGKNKVKGFKLDGKAFLIQNIDSVKQDKFNQLSGRTIDGLLREDTIRRIVVTGNAEIIYFPKNKSKIIGMNRTTCTEIYMWMVKGEVDRITLKPKTDGVIDPIEDVDLPNAKLKGFTWQIDKRPKSRFELHKRK